MPDTLDQHRGLLLGVLLLTVVVTDLGVAFALHDSFLRYDWPGIAYRALALGQGSMLALWATLAGRPRPWRVTVTIVVLAIMTKWLYADLSTSCIAILGYVVLEHFVVMSVLLTVGRLVELTGRARLQSTVGNATHKHATLTLALTDLVVQCIVQALAVEAA